MRPWLILRQGILFKLLTGLVSVVFCLGTWACEETGLTGSRRRGGGQEGAPKDQEGGGQDPTSKQRPGSGDASVPNRPHTVMIIDDGFDITHEVFKSKIVGQYTIFCPDDLVNLVDTEFSFSSLDQAKRTLLSRYRSKEGQCRVSEGIKFEVPSSFASIATIRERWNQGLLSKTGTVDRNTAQAVTSVLSGRTGGESHGTATAGLIAYQNPDVKLVLVQMDLASSNSPPRRAPCPTQRSVDLWIEAHRDPEVRRAYVDGAINDMEQGLNDVLKKHQVTLVNMSFGRAPRAVREDALAQAGCGTIDFKGFYAVSSELDAARAKRADAEAKAKGIPNPLSIQAAGNDGIQVNSSSDTFECSKPGMNLVIAGSIDSSGNRSSFSNYGACIDYYVLGSRVVVAAPQGFLRVVDGTSFSAPLLVRYVTKEFQGSASPQSMTSGLKSKADSERRIKGKLVPVELAYDVDTQKISAYTLTEDGATPPPPHYIPDAFRWSRLPR